MEGSWANPRPGGGRVPPRWDLDRQYGGLRRLPLRKAVPLRKEPQPALPKRAVLGSNSSRHLGKGVLWALAGVTLGASLAFGAAASRRAVTPVELVSWGTVEESVPVRALVIRREQVEVAPISGRLLRLTGEGQQVTAGAAVVELVNPEAQVSLASRAEGVKEAWDHFQKEKEGERRLVLQRTAELQAAVQESLGNLRQAAALADEKGMQQAWASLDQASGKLAAAREALSRLEQQRAELLSQQARVGSLGREAVVRLTAAEGGLVFYQVDGLEPALRPDRLTEVDLSLTEHPPEMVPPATDRVLAGQPLFKVVDPEYAVLAFRLTEPQAEGLARRSEVRLKLTDPSGSPPEEFVGQLLFLGPAEPGGRRAVFVRLQSLLGGKLALKRVLEASVLLKTAQGPRVPVTALTADPGSPASGETNARSSAPTGSGLGVHVADGGRARWVPVEVEATDGTWAVVSGVRAGVVLAPPGRQRKIR